MMQPLLSLAYIGMLVGGGVSIFLYKKFKTNIFLSIGLSLLIVLLFSFLFPMDLLSSLSLFIFNVIIIEIIHYVFVTSKTDPYIPKYFQINHHGRAIEDIKKGKKGKVLLDAPLLGDEVWNAFSDEFIKKGERVVIDEIRGQILFVKKEEEKK